MRTAFARRSSAIALAGVLALAGAACEEDGEDTDVVTDEETAEEEVVEEDTATEEVVEQDTATE